MQRLLTFELRRSVFAMVVTATTLFAVNAVNAQPSPAGGPPSAPAAGSFSEDFDAGPLKGWEFSCQQSLIATQDGQALQASGGGHAIWTSAGSVNDFVLQFRFGYQQGIGDVIFRMTETQAGMECYCLMLQPQGLVLVRRLHTPDGQFPEQQLVAVEGALPSGAMARIHRPGHRRADRCCHRRSEGAQLSRSDSAGQRDVRPGSDCQFRRRAVRRCQPGRARVRCRRSFAVPDGSCGQLALRHADVLRPPFGEDQ